MIFFLGAMGLLLACVVIAYGIRMLRRPLHLDRQNSVTLTIYLAVAASFIPALVQVLIVTRRANTVVESVATARASTLASVVLVCVLLAVALLCLVWMPRIDINTFLITTLVSLPWLATVISTLWFGGSFSYMTIVYPIFALFVLAMHARVHSLHAVGVSTALIAFLSITLGLLVPDRGLLHGASGRMAEADKAILGDYLLAGPFTHSNVLGVVLALGFSWIYLMKSRIARLVSFFVIFGALLWSGSRTGIVAAFASIALFWILGKISGKRTKHFLVYLSIVVPVLTTIFLPLISDDPASFSYRGQIWRGSLSAWRDNIFSGNGYSWYSRVGQYENSLIDIAFNGHNWFVHLLTTGGVVMALCVLPLLVFSSRNAAFYAARGNVAPACFMVSLAVVACLEVPTRFRDFDVLFPFSVIPLLIICVPVRRIVSQHCPLPIRDLSVHKSE